MVRSRDVRLLDRKERRELPWPILLLRHVQATTLPLSDAQKIDRIEVLSVAKIIADALSAVFDETSVSELFGGENQS